MDYLISALSRTNFTSLLPLFIGFISYIFTRNTKNNHIRFRWIRLYPLLFAIYSLLYDLSIIIFSYFKIPFNYGREIQLIADLIFTIVEFFIITFYFKHLKEYSHQNHLKIISILFVTIITAILIIDLQHYGVLYYKTVQKIFTIQAALLAFPCFYFYKNLFTNSPESNLIKDPDFWISTGISFFMICTFPFSLFISQLRDSLYFQIEYLFSIFDIFYCLLFIMIMIGLKWEPTTK